MEQEKRARQLWAVRQMLLDRRAGIKKDNRVGIIVDPPKKLEPQPKAARIDSTNDFNNESSEANMESIINELPTDKLPNDKNATTQNKVVWDKLIMRIIILLFVMVCGLIIFEKEKKASRLRAAAREEAERKSHEEYERAVANGTIYDYPLSIKLECSNTGYCLLAFSVAHALSRDDWQDSLNKELEEVEKWYKECVDSFEASVRRLKNPNTLSGFDNQQLQEDRWRIEGVGRVLHEYRRLYRDLLKAPAGTFPAIVGHLVSPDGDTYLGRIGQRIFNIDAMRKRYQAFDGDDL